MNAKVMLVDDEEMIRDSVVLFFQEAGVEIITVSSGIECVELLRKGFRGVILMDVMMPGMNGWDTIRMIVENELYDGSIIVMLTALDTPDSRMDGLQEYVTDYMTKPFDPQELVSSIAYYESLLDEAASGNE